VTDNSHTSHVLADPWAAWRRRIITPTPDTRRLEKVAVDLLHLAGIGLAVWMLVR